MITHLIEQIKRDNQSSFIIESYFRGSWIFTFKIYISAEDQIINISLPRSTIQIETKSFILAFDKFTLQTVCKKGIFYICYNNKVYLSNEK